MRTYTSQGRRVRQRLCLCTPARGLVPLHGRAGARLLHPDPCDLMAIYHLSADIVRRSAGRTVTAAAAYRSGECITDARIGLTFDYRPRRGVAHTEILAPDDAQPWMRDRSRLWNTTEAKEKRKDAQLARDITLALPHELAPAVRLDLVRRFVDSAFVSLGMVADIAIHEPSRRDADHRNHHAHLLLTMRAIEGDGFGAKVRAWNDTALLEQWRASWADHVNRALEHAGENARVDHRSLAAQGIEREPQIHLGVAVVEMTAQGIATERAEIVREIEAINTALAAVEEPALTPPMTTPVPSPHDLVRLSERRRGRMLAMFRSAARRVWERVQVAMRPVSSHSCTVQRNSL